jgi:hypothetical protein
LQFAIAWNRTNVSSTSGANLDLRLLRGSTVLLDSNTSSNTEEFVRYKATKSETLSIVVTNKSGGSVSFGWACNLNTGGGGGTPGAYTFYDAGCKGTGSGGAGQNCGSVNGNGGTLTTWTRTNEYCYGYKATKDLTVVSFSLYTQRITGSGTMTCALYGPTNSATPPTASAATGTMTVGANVGWYTAKLSNPITVKAGQNLWVSQYDTQNIRAANLTTGTPQMLPTFWRRPAGGTGAWGTSSIVQFPSFRINCAGGAGGAVPRLSNNGTPIVGQRFTLQIDQAAKNTRAYILFGAKTAKIDITILGAPGCFVLATATPIVTLPMNIGNDGSGSLSLNIPNLKTLLQKSFYNQGIVIDAKANRLGVALTGGGKGTVGNF